MTVVLAYDLGASSGRLTVQKFDGKKLTLSEIHRFSNEPKKVNDHFYWDYQRLLKNLTDGLNKVDFPVASLGIDTWGVDFGLVNESGQLLCDPFSYRDTHSTPFVKKILNTISHYDLYQRTGNEISSINTIFQLMAIHHHFKPILKETNAILLMPNLLVHTLSNERINEFTISSTTQLLNIHTKQWDYSLMLQLFEQNLLLCPIESPHQIIGNLASFPSIKMALVPGHDTACALSALPIQNETAIFISLGTWGLIGTELEEPILSIEAFKGGFTNEGTSEGYIRFQKNATGFWILQQLRKEWKQQGLQIDFEFEREAYGQSKPFQAFINPEDERFFNPHSMIEAIQTFCKETKQPVPNTVGEFIRVFSESVAIHYAKVISQIETLTKRSCPTIYIGGGGVQNETLCQLIANATGKRVCTGPIEASSIGNGLSQLRALGEVASLEEGRQIVQQSFMTKEFEPKNTAQWLEMRAQYELIL